MLAQAVIRKLDGLCFILDYPYSYYCRRTKQYYYTITVIRHGFTPLPNKGYNCYLLVEQLLHHYLEVKT
jgi:hypothetical protein